MVKPLLICKNLCFVLIALALLIFGCSGGGGGGGDTPGSPGGSDPIDYISLSGEPTVVLPAAYAVSTVIIQPSAIEVPERINHHYIPIGEAYSITLEEYPWGVDFAGDFAVITYNYARDEFLRSGLIEDFTVFSYNETGGVWEPVDYMNYDSVAGTVSGHTSHFTTFVLAALPSQSGTVADPPSCMSADFPDGIGGSGNTQFTIIDGNFKYYIDRDYYILPISESSENARTFGAFGFEGALGIATCNGNSDYGPYSQHKHYTGTDYITFTAHTDIDVYVMYDTRGGTGADRKNDISQDAPWLTDLGFTADIDGERYFIETTDNVRFYTVYKKSYPAGSTVALHGNRRGVTDTKIDTNYWVIIKPKDDRAPGSASDLCVANPVNYETPVISNLRAVPGSKQITLLWQNPDDIRFGGVVIRRSKIVPPMKIGEGEAPTGTILSEQGYLDSGLTQNQLYYYTVFSLDLNNNYVIGGSVSATTSKDSDSDGLSDIYEGSIGTDPNNPDTSGNGISDWESIVAGIDPFAVDSEPPVITSFVHTSSSPTGNRTITFTIEATDDIGVTGWMVTQISAKPSGNHSGWIDEVPLSYTVQGPGTYTLHAWARDDAGNVSDAETFTVEITDEVPSLEGTVKNTGGTPVGNALVSIFNSGGYEQHTASLANGYYCFYNVPSGTYYVTARRDGYTYFTATVTIP